MQEQVKAFHQKYEVLINDRPTIISPMLALCRTRYIIEEVGELAKAQTESNIVEIADALVDILYFVFGTALIYGLDLEPLFDEIQRSNMSKTGRCQITGKILKGDSYSPPDLRSLIYGDE